MHRTGAIGALVDIYEQVIAAFCQLIEDIPDEMLCRIADADTTDEHCRSIQAILAHVVHSGYGYATAIHNLHGPKSERPAIQFRNTAPAYISDMEKMFAYTEEVFSRLQDSDLEETDNTRKIMTGWGQLYDIEQLTEHAIVHILRHHRQVAKMKQQLQ